MRDCKRPYGVQDLGGQALLDLSTRMRLGRGQASIHNTGCFAEALETLPPSGLTSRLPDGIAFLGEPFPEGPTGRRRGQ